MSRQFFENKSKNNVFKNRNPQKTTFIPFPIKPQFITSENSNSYIHVDNHQVLPLNTPKKVKLFIGINKSRSEYKGTDIMLKAAQDIAQKYPDQVELRVAEGVPFAEYVEMMNAAMLSSTSSTVILQV